MLACEDGRVRILVTGSAGHLGEALVRVLRTDGEEVVGLDVVESPYTDTVGSILDRGSVRRCLEGVEAVIHTASLHKPHIGIRLRSDFVETNISGTLNLLEEAATTGIGAFVFTSTTSAYGDALTPPSGSPAAWITEQVRPLPKNIYGVTKTAAEDLCELFSRDRRLACVVLRTSRFFPEPDDSDEIRRSYDDLNTKVNELLYRRVDIDDVVTAHRLALERADSIGFGRYVISATTPFSLEDLADIRADAPRVVRRVFPDCEEIYAERGWAVSPVIDRVYVNALARRDLGWRPRYDFGHALERLRLGQDPRSPLALEIGAKGYDARTAHHGARIAGGDRSCREADVMKARGDLDRPAPSRQVPC
jgi:UDP-glucose 4-epimerase